MKSGETNRKQLIVSILFNIYLFHFWFVEVTLLILCSARERNHWGDPGVDGRIILRWIFRKWDVGVWTGLSWLRIETGGGHL
jgi:hypothetical protein